MIFLAYVIFQLKTKYSQKKHVKVKFFTVQTNPIPHTSVGCTRYFVGLVLTVELAPLYLLFARTNPT